MRRESHHFSTNDGTFPRRIAGPHKLQDEGQRMRSQRQYTSTRSRFRSTSKPIFMFMNMRFQKHVNSKPTERAPVAEGFPPRQPENDFNHAADQ